MIHVYLHLDGASLIRTDEYKTHVSIVIAEDSVSGTDGQDIPVDPAVSIMVNNLIDLDRLERAIVDARNKLLAMRDRPKEEVDHAY